jgi:hypothetical protein
MCILTGAHAADAPVADEETRAFATYVNDVERLDGMFHGVLDYCVQYVPKTIVAQSEAAWKFNNGPYIDAVDVAIEKYATARAEPGRKAEIIEELKANAKTWFQQAHDQSKILDQVKAAQTPSLSCSRMLGVLSSDSFHLKTMMPGDHEYWVRNLNPR